MIKTGKFVGIDIGSKKMKIVEVLHQRKSFKFSNFIILDTPISKAETYDRPRVDMNRAAKLLKEAAIEKKIDITSPYISIFLSPNSLVNSLFISVSKKIPRKELPMILKNEAMAKMIPTPPSTMVFSYLETKEGSGSTDKSDETGFLVVGIEGSEIERIENALIDYEIFPVQVTIAPYSLTNLLRWFNLIDSKTVGIIDIGYLSSSLSVISNNSLTFFRHIPIGYYDFALCVSENLVLDKEGAEVYLAEKGLTDECGEKTATLFRRFSTEIDRSLVYYKEHFQDQNINSVYLTGGGSKISQITRILGLDVMVLNPFFKNAMMEEEFLPEGSKESLNLLSTALGLTAIEKTKSRLDFSSETLKGKIKSRLLASRLVYGFFFIAVLYIWAFFILHHFELKLMNELARLESKFSYFGDFKSEYKKCVEVKKKFDQRKTLLDELEKKGYAKLQELIQVTFGALPAEITLHKFSILEKGAAGSSGEGMNLNMPGSGGDMPGSGGNMFTGNNNMSGQVQKQSGGLFVIDIEGDIVADYYSSESLLDGFQAELENSGFFENISVELEKIEWDKNISNKLNRKLKRNITILADLK